MTDERTDLSREGGDDDEDAAAGAFVEPHRAQSV